MRPEDAITQVRDGLRDLGYTENLLLTEYRFTDLTTADGTVRTAELAAFAQNPPSYRTACFGVARVRTNAATEIEAYRFLGAPQILAVRDDSGSGGEEIVVWRMTAQGPPEPREIIRTGQTVSLREVIARRTDWRPDPVFRAKSIAFADRSPQLDFFDLGLLPVIESVVHRKLNDLLLDVVARSVEVYREYNAAELDDAAYAALFRLIFRFLAAKMLGDRGHVAPGVDWSTDDASAIIRAVDRFYFGDDPQENRTGILGDVHVRATAWDKIRRGFRFENLSVEALAYVYENAFVTRKTRREHGTHATPREVTEFVLRHLPLETLPQDERIIFEPFAGAAPFLVTGLARLRDLLPAEWTDKQRHAYFIRMLHGMERDPFAREVARYSLILADYPNPNGWDIAEADVYNSGQFAGYLNQARIVLCNPPYERFTSNEREYYGPGLGADKAVQALNLILRNPPKMLGFVLPRLFLNGQSYREAQAILDRSYTNIDIVELPEGIFRHSLAETALLLAYGEGGGTFRKRLTSIPRLSYPKLLETDALVWRETTVVESSTPSSSVLLLPIQPRDGNAADSVLDYLSAQSRMEQVAEVHRGVEYHAWVPESDRFSEEERPGFAPGLREARRVMKPYTVPEYTYLNLDPQVIRRGKGQPWDAMKVIVNASRISRGNWVLAAVVDYERLACTERFHGIWPTGPTPLEVIAAVLNGPVANVWLKSLSTDRNNQRRYVRTVPMPTIGETAAELIGSYVSQYLNLTTLLEDEDLSSADRTRVESKRDDILLRIDAAILAGYGLEPGTERELLALFDGQRRPGTRMTGYDETQFEDTKAKYRRDLEEAQHVKRYHELVDRKYLATLTTAELIELDDLSATLDQYDTGFYAPMLRD